MFDEKFVISGKSYNLYFELFKNVTTFAMLQLRRKCDVFYHYLSTFFRELEHTNLCKFIGASIDIPYVYILTEYCPKGSLYDVLQNDDIPLNWSFRISFATDIARGMAYMHSRKLYHGRLKSSNCCIDDRWTIKITGFF